VTRPRAPHALLLSALLACAGPPPAPEPAPPAPAAQPAPQPAPAAYAGEATAAEALAAWTRAVSTGQTPAVLALVDQPIVFRTRMMLERPPEQTLTREQLGAALDEGQGRVLGLHDGHLLPRAQDLETEGGRAVGVDPRCPAVTWTFEERGGRWFLAEVLFVPLEC